MIKLWFQFMPKPWFSTRNFNCKTWKVSLFCSLLDVSVIKVWDWDCIDRLLGKLRFRCCCRYFLCKEKELLFWRFFLLCNNNQNVYGAKYSLKNLRLTFGNLNISEYIWIRSQTEYFRSFIFFNKELIYCFVML